MRFSTIIRLSLGRAVISKNTHRFLKSSAVLNESEMSVHPIAESGFSSSELYDRVRPGYSKEAVRFLLHKLGVVYGKNATSNMQPTHILELGAGTGKFTRTLQDVLRGSNVEMITSEPVLSMRQEFAKIFPELKIKAFSAENIGNEWEIQKTSCILDMVEAREPRCVTTPCKTINFQGRHCPLPAYPRDWMTSRPLTVNPLLSPPLK